jgi:L-alanine-DL-glutamate epimerase-like enolase superfamily enzyme
MQATQKIFMTKLRYPFGISRGVDTEIPTVLLRLGDLGMGEGSPVRYKKQNAEEVLAAVADLASQVTEANIDDIEGHDKKARAKYPQLSAAVAALNMALWDARGRREKKPIHQLIGAGVPKLQTTYTVSLSDHDTMQKRAEEAAHLPFLKVKLGRDAEFDLEAMRRIKKAAPKATLRVDANAGWSLDTAKAIIPKLADMGVEYVEQPLAIGNLEELAKLNRDAALPIFVDEDAQDVASLKALRGKCAGINIKLMKCGGLSEALKMITFAGDEGWMIMVGCMIETRLGLGAAAHLAGLIDYIDLDAHMLTTNDPFPPGSQSVYTADLPVSGGPGIGTPLLDL